MLPANQTAAGAGAYDKRLPRPRALDCFHWNTSLLL